MKRKTKQLRSMSYHVTPPRTRSIPVMGGRGVTLKRMDFPWMIWLIFRVGKVWPPIFMAMMCRRDPRLNDKVRFWGCPADIPHWTLSGFVCLGATAAQVKTTKDLEKGFFNTIFLDRPRRLKRPKNYILGGLPEWQSNWRQEGQLPSPWLPPR